MPAQADRIHIRQRVPLLLNEVKGNLPGFCLWRQHYLQAVVLLAGKNIIALNSLR